MANITSVGPQPLKPTTSNTSVVTSNVAKRQSIDLLPGAYQTTTLTKFFNATIDHLMQPENVEFLSGYIGSKPAYYNPAKDFYISEPTIDRTNYQLPATAVSIDPASGLTSNVMFYDDLLNHLKMQGSNTEDPSRLLDSEYYSWCPPIDLDKFVNYNEYYWLTNGPGLIELLDQTDLLNDALNKPYYTYDGQYKLVSFNTIKTGKLSFSTGMIVVTANDQNPQLNGRSLAIEGVGKSILIKDDSKYTNPGWDLAGWDTVGWGGGAEATVPNYMTIARMCSDLNRWSVNNRWYHRDVVEQSGINLRDLEDLKAYRPIIEFERDIPLWNFGNRGRPDVDLVDDVNANVFEAIAGKPSYILDGNELSDGMRILVKADLNVEVNNRIYQVSGINTYGVITLELVADGINLDGSAAQGECVFVNFGDKNANRTYWFNGNSWIKAQDFIINQAPLFLLYDHSGNRLDDPAVYPGSDFQGNPIFTYVIDSNSPIDVEMGVRIKRDQFGDVIFENSISTTLYTYIEENQRVQFQGYKWYQTSQSLANTWYRCENNSRQYVFNSFDVAVPTTTFLVDQRAADELQNQLPTVIVNKISNGYSQKLVKNLDYTIEGRIITLSQPAATGDRIEILTWAIGPRIGKSGYYTLPANLVSNPNNQEPQTPSYNDVVQQFSQIIANQLSEPSNGIGNTTWRDNAQVRGLGTSILQHRAPVLKLSMLNSTNINTGILTSTSQTDVSLAIQFAQKEYLRFYNRFIRSLFNLYNNQGFGKTTPVQTWIDSALAQVNLGKSKASAWAYSGYEQTADFTSTATKPTFIPPTPARLGVAPVYKPMVYIEQQYNVDKLVIQTHDGARIIMEDLEGNMLGTIEQGYKTTTNPNLLTNPVASAWLQLELNIYNALPHHYQDADAVLMFDQRINVPGKWRNTGYQRNEYIDIMRPTFDKWIINSQVDYRANVTYTINDQFSFNYSTCVDQDGQPIPGYWKGIYRWFYDTDRPHSHPWEMLGFSQKPQWWDSEYGEAPYTRGNLKLWTDLQDGRIRSGARSGINSAWARPGLMKYIPVDDQGDLLPPLLSGTVVSLPSLIDAQAEWEFGDGAPVETVWLTSIDHGFILAIGGYLMKPAQFIEQGWDPLRTKIVGTGDSQQLIYLNTNDRRPSSEFYVHRENPIEINNTSSIPNESTLTFFGSWGIQHWISEYLVSQNLNVTVYFGNIIRGSGVQLAHKFGGYIGSDNSIRVMADSFGQVGYSSQIIPSENVKTYLYRSTSIGEYFYSGVVIVKQRNGWRIYGYDGVNPMFTVIPSIESGPKSTIVIGNQAIVDYQIGEGTSTVPYGTVLGSRQDVYDFIVSYGRWLENQGWVFDTVNFENSRVVNWRQSARDFVYWSQGNWADGNFIALSPAASSAKFTIDFGNIQYVSGTVAGTYPVLDKTGKPIEKQNLEVLRQDGEIVIKTLNEQSVFGLRLFVTTIENIMVLDNVTQFNDLIYDPLYSVYQPRLKIYAYRTNNWTGRLDAPGYILYQNPTNNQWSLISNFEKTADDFRKLYNIDQPKNIMKIDSNNGDLVVASNQEYAVTRSDMSNLAKHLIGYQDRNYMQNMLLDDTTRFQFYQGFIKQKGSNRALDSMLRNRNVLGEDQQINYYEEYALRQSRYGASSLNTNIDFILTQSEFVNNPQRIDVFSNYLSDQSRDGVIILTPRDPRIVVLPENYEGKMFPLRDHVGDNFYQDLPNAGYLQLGETDYYVVDTAALLSLSVDLNNDGNKLEYGDTIWQAITDDLTWNVWKLARPTAEVLNTVASNVVGNPTQIIFDGPHGIVNGDIVVANGFVNNAGLNGTFTAQNVTVNSISIPVNTFIDDQGGTVGVLRSVRYNTFDDLESNPLLGGWQDGDTVYIDNDTEQGAWAVYENRQQSWNAVRRAIKKVNVNLILQSKLYNKNNRNTLLQLEYYDPAKGLIPGTAQREITYRNLFDPAKYNRGDETVYGLNPDIAWLKSHVGEIWWDLSTTRYVDYEQGDLDYRAKNWGKLAPDTDIDVYEWVRSPIPPRDWASYVLGGISLAQYGIDYIPSGTVRNPDNPAWCETVEYDINGNAKTWYYFWVGNSDIPPTVENRNLTTNQITTIIKNPSGNNLPWYAMIGERSIIIANVNSKVHANDTVMQIVYTNRSNDSNDYKDWSLVREGDPKTVIDEQYWQKLRDSLTGFDNLNNVVPDPELNELNRYGTLIRPRQSWFVDRLKALSIWTNKVNSQLSSASIPLTLDPEKSAWPDWFDQSEPVPDQTGNWEYKVTDMSGLAFIPVRRPDGSRALVMPTASNNNLWTIWSWSAANNQWTLVRTQSYNVQNYWKYIDWYLSGYSADLIPTYIVDTLSDLETVVFSNGQIARVNNNGDGRWAWYALVNNQRQLVALQDGTIEITSNLWDSNVNLYGWDRRGFDAIPFDYNPTQEIGIIFDGIRNGLYGSGGAAELNDLFFSMINYVLSEQKYVDWIFKTSFMLVSGSNEPLTTNQLYKPSTVDNLIEYINEIKPYRSKIRDFISSRSASETALISAGDFDKPPYNGTILDPNVPADLTILSTDPTYSQWFNNYQTNTNLIRNIKTRLVFDRVSDLPTPINIANAYSSGRTVSFTLDTQNGNTFVLGERIMVSNVVTVENNINFNSPLVTITSISGNVVVGTYGVNIGIGEGTGGVIYKNTSGAADRIINYYQPTAFMPQLDSPDLIPGTDYKGRVYSGTDLSMSPGWGMAQWDMPIGWDADEKTIDEYIEVIIEGGMPLVYDQFYGNGTRTQYQLSRIPQDLMHTRIWKDNMLATYGIDYTVPNWATGVEIAYAGTGYKTGDILVLVTDQPIANSKNIEIEVTAVNSTGGIVDAQVINRGYYPLIQHDPHTAVYKPYQVETGRDAVIQPIWGGNTLIFTDPPESSWLPNIWVLYAGTTFEPAPEGEDDVITDGYAFVAPEVEEGHPEELYRLKARDAVRIDTYTEPVGGRPSVFNKSYVTDGLTDHFSLGIRPQNTAAVLAYLDGVILRYGAEYDYVINFETGHIVFMRPPAAGKNLTTMAIGEGGSGNNVRSAVPVNPGTNYTVGNTIVLSGGVGTPASVAVKSVTAVSVVLLNSGNRYRVGDVIILNNDTLTEYVTKVILEVARVEDDGEIAEFIVKSSGIYTVIPTSISWSTTSNGIGANFGITWGIHSVDVIDPGFYTTKPTQPVEQQSVVPSGGQDATFNVKYTSIVDQELFTADGINSIFKLKKTLPEYYSLMVTTNGTAVNSSDVTVVDNEVTLLIVPDYGALVVITVFDTPNYSIVFDSEITAARDEVGDLIFEYNLNRTAFDTQPNYATSVVSVNGKIIPPPPITTRISNGYTRQIYLDYTPTDAALINVYVNGISQTYITDWQFVDNSIVLTYDPAVAAVISVVTLDPEYGYYYKLENDQIIFSNLSQVGFDTLVFDDALGFDYGATAEFSNIIEEGYRISVTNFSQDVAYRFVTEQFVGNSQGVYELSGIPSAESTISVNIDGVEQRMLWDYAVDTVDIEGFDTQGFDLADFDQGFETVTFIKFNANNPTQNDQSLITVRYMIGLTERPATAFRQFINHNSVRSSQVLSDRSRTVLLDNVYVNTDTIAVADYTVLSQPTLLNQGYVWINNERIGFTEIRPRPTPQYPRAGQLCNLTRNTGGTSGDPIVEYNVVFYDGDGATRLFKSNSESGYETVFVNGKLALSNTYTIVIDPPLLPVGRYIQFSTDYIPSVGYKNIKITSLINDPSRIALCHEQGAIVQDSGINVKIPGGYIWEPNENGLQYSDSAMAKFILENIGTPS